MPRILLLSLLLLGGVFGANAEEVKTVMEGDSVTLNPDLSQIQGVIEILWWFGEDGSTIAQTDGNKPLYKDVKGFKGRLKLDQQTGSLTITNVRINHSGRYKAEINHNAGTLNQDFSLTVYESPSVIAEGETELKSVSVKEGDPVTLHVPQIQGDELIVWRFGDEGKLIAKADIETKSSSLYDETEERFRDRLKLDQTGSLIITNTRTTDSGEFKVKINSNKQTSYKRFTVTVSGGVALDGDLQEGWDLHFQCYQSKGSRCCGFTEAVIQLVLSALVGVAGVVILVYEFRTRTRVCGQ